MTTPLETKVAAIRTTTDVAGLKKAVAAIAKLATPEAYAAMWDLAFAPPKLPYKNGLAFIVLTALGARIKKHEAVRELFVERCQDLAEITDTDADDTRHAITILAHWMFEHKAEAAADPRMCAALRRTLAWQDRDAIENAVFILTKLGDAASLPAMLALLDTTKRDDAGLVSRLAEAMVALPGATAKDLAKLRASAARLAGAHELYTKRIDKAIAKLAKRLG